MYPYRIPSFYRIMEDFQSVKCKVDLMTTFTECEIKCQNYMFIVMLEKEKQATSAGGDAIIRG